MNKDENTVLLDDVLTAFRREGGAPTPDVVDTWCRRFPRFAEAIAEEAMGWAEEEMMAALHRTAPEDEAEVERTRSRAFAAAERASMPAVSPGTFEEALQAAGLDHIEAARQMGLPRTVVEVPPSYGRMRYLRDADGNPAEFETGQEAVQVAASLGRLTGLPAPAPHQGKGRG